MTIINGYKKEKIKMRKIIIKKYDLKTIFKDDTNTDEISVIDNKIANLLEEVLEDRCTEKIITKEDSFVKKELFFGY